MIDTIFPNRVDSPVIDLGADTFFQYQGIITIASDKVSFPGVPVLRQYAKLMMNGYTYKVVAQDASGITVDRSPGPARTFSGRITLGYAVDDGRNPANWATGKLTIKSISPGSMVFNENFRVMQKYCATLINDVESSGGILPAGTTFSWRTKVNSDPAILIRKSVSDGVVTLQFSKNIGECGIIDGVEIDRIEAEDDTIRIFTPTVGLAQIELSGFADEFGNQMDDLSIDVNIAVENQVFDYNENKYRMKSRGRYDFEDFMSAEEQSWLYQKLDLE